MANTLGVVDFAGGTAVEINSGASALAVALVVGRRVGFGKDPMRPHNLTLVMLGAGLLWFGWFGFNAGSALGANHTAAVVFVNTLLAGCTGALAWLLVERSATGTPPRSVPPPGSWPAGRDHAVLLLGLAGRRDGDGRARRRRSARSRSG